MTGRGDTGERAQVVWLPPAFPLEEDWTEKDREGIQSRVWMGIVVDQGRR